MAKIAKKESKKPAFIKEKMKQEDIHNPPEPTLVKAKAKKHPGRAC